MWLNERMSLTYITTSRVRVEHKKELCWHFFFLFRTSAVIMNLDRIMKNNVPSTAIVHRNYLQRLPQGTRNPRARDCDIWTRPSHTPDFLHCMNRHPSGTTELDWRLETSETRCDVNANLDSTTWRRCRLPVRRRR